MQNTVLHLKLGLHTERKWNTQCFMNEEKKTTKIKNKLSKYSLFKPLICKDSLMKWDDQFTTDMSLYYITAFQFEHIITVLLILQKQISCSHLVEKNTVGGSLVSLEAKGYDSVGQQRTLLFFFLLI